MKRAILKTFVGLAVVVCLTLGASPSSGQEAVTLTVIGDAGHNLKPFEWYAPIFREEFGVELKVIGVPFGELYEKEKIEFVAQTGAFDICIVYPKFIGDFAGAGYLLNLDEYAAKLGPRMADVAPGYRDFYCKFGGSVYAVPYDGDVLSLYYRKDLFENAGEKAAFKSQFGHELRAPATWDEYLEVAKFFRREADEKLAGQTLKTPFYGTAFYGQRDQIYAWWGNRFASMGGVYFDEETMKPAINSKAGVDALENMKAVMPYCPPDVLAYGYEELKDIFLNGDAAMVVQWPCVGKKGADPNQSKIVGKIGLAPVPGVMKEGKVYSRAMMPCGRVLAVPADSKHAWKAYQVIQWLAVVSSTADVSTPLTGLDPYRFSHFETPEAFEMFPTVEDAKVYLAGIQANMSNGYPEPPIPGSVEYIDALAVNITRALTGEKSSKEALDEAAKEWENITARFGVEKQRKLYRELVAGWRAAGLWE